MSMSCLCLLLCEGLPFAYFPDERHSVHQTQLTPNTRHLRDVHDWQTSGSEWHTQGMMLVCKKRRHSFLYLNSDNSKVHNIGHYNKGLSHSHHHHHQHSCLIAIIGYDTMLDNSWLRGTRKWQFALNYTFGTVVTGFRHAFLVFKSVKTY